MPKLQRIVAGKYKNKSFLREQDLDVDMKDTQPDADDADVDVDDDDDVVIIASRKHLEDVVQQGISENTIWDAEVDMLTNKQAHLKLDSMQDPKSHGSKQMAEKWLDNEEVQPKDYATGCTELGIDKISPRFLDMKPTSTFKS